MAAVAFAEIGDKTQLLAIVLAAHFRKPLPIILGMLAATIANHFLAALIGFEAAAWLDSRAFHYGVAVSFIAMAAWTLIPDKLQGELHKLPHFGPFLTTLVAFFFVEIGDKTQIATAALAARFREVVPVTAGTTIGMMIANVPAIFLGKAALHKVPMAAVHRVAAALFLAVGLWLLYQTWRGA
jgi:putative Ca2+/H+ antiporter (TMEM165/GDT1 family)